ncbi:hypothetical protein BGX30_002719 [Mortierella sp. GBA39]|nr:hypothetical protein BGX30_002719 [Mortierella sp. GBA39]
MKYRKLGKTGLEVSALSFGASSLGSVFRDTDEQESLRTVHEAIDSGINYIDVSPYYGLTKAETVLGKALKDIPRDRYLLSTKAGRYGENEFDFSHNRIVTSLDESLKRLNVDEVDILFLHDIEFVPAQIILEEALPALEKLKQAGKIRLLDLLPLLEERNTGLVNASPISMGLLSTRGTPAWHPADPEIKEACLKAAQFCADQGEDIAKLAVQFSTSNERIPTTLVSTANPENIRRNASWVEEPVDERLLSEVLAILEPVHNRTWTSGRPEYNTKIGEA